MDRDTRRRPVFDEPDHPPIIVAAPTGVATGNGVATLAGHARTDAMAGANAWPAPRMRGFADRPPRTD